MGLKVGFATNDAGAVDMVVTVDKWNHYDNKHNKAIMHLTPEIQS